MKISGCRIMKRRVFLRLFFSATLRKWGRGKRENENEGENERGGERKGEREVPHSVVTHQKVRRQTCISEL